jgi:hypothetical protein
MPLIQRKAPRAIIADPMKPECQMPLALFTRDVPPVLLKSGALAGGTRASARLIYRLATAREKRLASRSISDRISRSFFPTNDVAHIGAHHRQRENLC